MIGINIPMPERCFDCPLSYWIQSGYFEGMLMCNAKEANLARGKETNNELIGECIVDEFKKERPKDCPITDFDVELLKEQEPKKVIIDMYGNYCPWCSTKTSREMGVQKLHLGTKFCPYCGKPVKWNENP